MTIETMLERMVENEPVKVKVTVNPNNNPTYLHDGEYWATFQTDNIDFRQAIPDITNIWSAPGTWESLRMLSVWLKQNRVQIEFLEA